MSTGVETMDASKLHHLAAKRKGDHRARGTNLATSNSLADLRERLKIEHAAVVGALKTFRSRALACGDILIEAKAQLKHGQWLPWLKSCAVPERTAQAYMRLARNREKIEANPQTTADLTIDAALRSLAEAVGCAEQIEMPFPQSAGAQTPPIIRTRCADCALGLIVAGEWYMVWPHVWNQAWAGRLKRWRDAPGQQVLCVACLEQRIGRKLNWDDFTGANVNNPTRPSISPRLAARLEARGNELPPGDAAELDHDRMFEGRPQRLRRWRERKQRSRS
jgi:hypothetical protein